MSKAMKRIGIIKKISKKLPQYSYITIYKLFVRPHFGYGDVIYDLTNNERFSQKKLKNVIPCYSCNDTGRQNNISEYLHNK